LATGLLLAFAFTPASAQGLYFDIGFGYGSGTTKIDGQDMSDYFKSFGNIDELAVDLGLKLGYGPIAGNPIYVVGVFNGIGNRLDDGKDNIQFNSYLLGPGIIVYPVDMVQLGLSIGTSWVANQTSVPGIVLYDSDGGFAWDISAAVDLGGKNHACLLGIKYFSASNTLKTSKVKEESSAISVFVRYSFRHKNDK
jgi:hypothetical protein